MKTIKSTLTLLGLLICSVSFSQDAPVIIAEPQIGDISFKKHIQQSDFRGQHDLKMVDVNGEKIEGLIITGGYLFFENDMTPRAAIYRGGKLSDEAVHLLEKSSGKVLQLFFDYETPDGVPMQSIIRAPIY
ncbi:hypothetical protein JYT74_00290 [Crocinitomix catalasitica]|nr:hypothetical protein [Crocinitomix catalasitica]